MCYVHSQEEQSSCQFLLSTSRHCCHTKDLDFKECRIFCILSFTSSTSKLSRNDSDRQIQEIQERLTSLTMESKDISTRMYFEAFQPFSVTTGTRYPATSQGTIDFHRAAFFRRRNKGPFVSPRTATQEMLQHNCDGTRILPAAELAAINRLAKVIHDIRKNKAPYSPDLSIKAFPDLDLIFFNGRLGRNVSVNWSSDESDARLRDTLRPWGDLGRHA